AFELPEQRHRLSISGIAPILRTLRRRKLRNNDRIPYPVPAGAAGFATDHKRSAAHVWPFFADAAVLLSAQRDRWIDAGRTVPTWPALADACNIDRCTCVPFRLDTRRLDDASVHAAGRDDREHFGPGCQKTALHVFPRRQCERCNFDRDAG